MSVKYKYKYKWKYQYKYKYMFIVMCTCICTIILCRSMYHMLGWDILLQWLAKLRLQTKPLIEKLVAPMLACCCPSTSSTTKHNAAHPGLSKTCLLNPWHILTAPIDVLRKKNVRMWKESLVMSPIKARSNSSCWHGPPMKWVISTSPAAEI